jgi:hypothetical protein
MPGLRGQNTMKLTYSGKLSDNAKRQKRTAAGCVEKYCRNLINAGKITSNLNSCDEVGLALIIVTYCTNIDELQFPFASTDEGGAALPAIERAINCIPQAQNSHQGWVLKEFIAEKNLVAGDEYILSVDCDDVLGSINQPRDTVQETGSDSEFRKDIALHRLTIIGSYILSLYGR